MVDVAGAPRDMGRDHGEGMRGAIASGLDAWLAVVGRQTGMTGEAYVDSFLGATEFVKAIEVFAPRLLEEVRGIAEGARQRFETMLAYQMMDEEWAYRVTLNRARRSSREACTAVGVVHGDGTSVIGQNMDLPSHYDGTQVLLRLRPTDGAAVMAFTPAGMIGTTGINERGVGVCVNALFQLRHRSSGLPVAFVMRGALAQRTAGDAASLLKTVPHATGQNYLVGDGDRVEDYECSPEGAVEVPLAGAQVAHTNHVLMSADFDPVHSDPRADSTTVARLESVRAALTDLGADAARDDVMLALSAAPVCVPRGSDWMTLGSVVMELGDAPVIWTALGPPDETGYARMTFS
ncbi:MAG TPA: C45 family peptidase [Candidatus Dormibacteraeota bacterium]|nr:C45 family peptidase [Candidatus Dormibacteraeota bacterium]